MKQPKNKLTHAIELQGKGRLDEAAKLFEEILSGNPHDAAALYSLGVILLNRGENGRVMQLAELGTRVAPKFAPLWFLFGSAQQKAGQLDEALKSYDAALEIQPDYIEVLTNSGALLRDMFRHKDAVERFNRILGIDPNNASALANCGILLTEFKQGEAAIAMFKRLLLVDPEYAYGLGLLCFEQLHICDWSDFVALKEKILEGVRNGKKVCKTLAMMAIVDSAEIQFEAARIFANHYAPAAPTALWRGERYRHKRIKLAYVSPDLREHPVGHLIAGVIERHDKTRFETIAISIGIDDQSRIRSRMLASFDQFIDARMIGARQIAEKMRELEVDIAVDLAGYTSDSRIEIFAHRPAPVQVNYLGYAGTLGTDYMDYILADRHVIPRESQQYYAEKVIYLPDAYLPTDSGIKISDRTPTRAECGLPEQGFVFCSFNHDYKISPSMFDVWMRLLCKVPGSVLWLMSRGDASQRNLQNAAQERGVDPSRLIFAKRVPLVEDHLARYRQADVFLDTHPYNAHTTAADALMAGLPVLTYTGNAFPSRVAGSLLHAIGLSEMVTTCLQEYEDLAMLLANHPDRLAAVKAKLRENKLTHPLFNTDLFCRDIEAAYMAMWRQSQLGNARDELGQVS